MGQWSGTASGKCDGCGYFTGYVKSIVLAGIFLRDHFDRAHRLTEDVISGENNKEKMDMRKSISDIKKEKGIGGPPMLHGSDVPQKLRSKELKVKIKELREAPSNFNSPAIIDFEEEVFGKVGMACNITNLRALAVFCGYDKAAADDVDFDALAKRAKGKVIALQVALTNNPKTQTMVPSLFIQTGE